MAERLLIIEDHHETARLLAAALAAEGFEVVVAATGEQGLALLKERTIEAVVLDFLLPLMSGIEVLEALAVLPASPPVVFITAAGLTDVAAAAARAGAFACVEKHLNYLPVLIAKLRAALAGRSLRLSSRRHVRSVFVGREQELQRLGELMAAAASGRGGLAYLVGEPGIGKSALARAAAERAAAVGLVPLWGRCRSSDAADAYAPWREVHYAQRRWRAASRGEEDSADAAVTYVPRLVPRLEAEIPTTWHTALDTALLESDAARLRRYGKVVHYFRLMAAQQPMLVLLEDVHLIDSASLQFLAYLAEHLRDIHVMVLGMLRPGEDDATASTLDAIAAGADGEVIRLEPFSRDEVALYVERATDRKPSDAVVSALYERTEGHPLFTVEVLRLLAANGDLIEAPDAAFWAALAPSRLHAVDLWLQMLSESHRCVLSVAALIGREFEVDVLRAAAGDLAAQLDATCEEALAHGLLSETDAPDVLRFSHELVREELARRLPRAERLGANLRIGQALERRYGANLQPHLSRLARHWLDGGDLERGVGCALRGADRQALLMAYPEAIRLYQTVLEADRQGCVLSAADRCAVLTRLAEVEWRAGRLQRAREVGRQAFDLAKELDDPDLLTAAVLGFAGQLPGYGPVASDETVVAALEYALGRVPPKRAGLRVLLLSRLVEELQFSPREVDHRPLVEEMRRLARRQRDPKIEARALRTAGWTGSAEEPAGRQALAEHYVSLAARANDPVLRLDGELLYVSSTLERGMMDAALQHLHTSSEAAAALRLPYYTWLVTVTRACVCLAGGQLDDALDLAHTAHRLGVDCGNPNAGLFFGVQWAHVQWMRGNLAEIPSLLDGMAQQFPVLRTTLRCGRAATLAEAGEIEAARGDLDVLAADDFAGLRRNVTWLTAVAYLAEVSSHLAAVAPAAVLYRLLAPFEPYLVLLTPLFSHGPVAHQLGTLAAVLGRTADAEKHFRRALGIEERLGTRHWVARTNLALARLLATTAPGDGRAATALIDAAQRIADQLRLPIVAARCDDLRTQLSAPSPRPSAPPPVSSTPTRCAIRRTGRFWEVQVDGRLPALVKHSNGVHHVIELIRHAGQSLSVFLLDSLLRGVPTVVEGRGGSRLDPTARRDAERELEALRAQWRKLEAEEAELHQEGATPVAERVRQRREAIEEQIEELVGWANEGSRPELGTAANNVRTNVCHAITTAIENFAKEIAPLGTHLKDHVKTGWHCSYFPDVRWSFEV